MKRTLLLTTVVVGALLVVLVWKATPWQAFPSPVDAPTKDFTATQIESAHQLRNQLRWLSLTPWALTLVVTLFLGVFSSRIFVRLPLVAAPWQTLIAVTVVSLVLMAIRLPFAIASLQVTRRAGLSTTTWSTWIIDLAKNFGLSLLLTWFALTALSWAAREWRSWWAIAALAAAALTVVMSFLMPVVFEPIFNKFTPMPQGQLRTSLLQLADRDGVPVRDVLIADASRRTTALNAYVSGFGATRRIVVYDTLIKDAPMSEVESVVAHELGHAKENDVLFGTALGAVAAAFGVLLLALLLGPRVADPKYVAAILATFSLLSLAQQPLSSLISRQIELRADHHALNLTQDPTTYAQMQKRLALVNRADLRTPRWVYLVFATHPSTMERITFSRQWARTNDLPIPADMAGK